jgi:4-hydroxy-2-oxoheptanedioate aldolase
MRGHTLKARFTAGEAAIGVLAPNRDPILAETLGLLGFDFYMIDGEHGALSAADAELLVRGCECVGVPPWARVRSLDPKLILQFLDAGVQGVMMPGLTRRDEVEAFVQAMKYPPMGQRGLGPVRAARYMLGGVVQAEYVQQANAQTLVLPQVEDIAAVDNVEALVSVPGIDGVIIGPRDLAMSMGFIDGPKHPEVDVAIARVVAAAKRAGIVVGTVAGTGAQARSLIAQGHQIVLTSAANLLANAAAPFLTEARAAAPGAA